MHPSIEFFVNGIPKAQPRPRAFARKFGNKWAARVYDAGTAECWKGQIALASKDLRPGEPITGPIALQVYFYLPRPKGHWRKDGTLRPGSPQYHTCAPDTDNLIKAVKDALGPLGFWGNDAQVCQETTVKRYAQQTGAAITIRQLEVQ